MTDHTLFSRGVYDGRYHAKTKELEMIASQYAFTRNRICIGAVYFYNLMIYLKHNDKVNLDIWNELIIKPTLMDIVNEENPDELNMTPNKDVVKMVEECLEIEKETNHDVAAIVQFLRNKYSELGIGPDEFKGYIHLGLTSQDLNTSANILITSQYNQYIVSRYPYQIIQSLRQIMNEAKQGYDYMLSLTHGQQATPTTLSWTINVFIDRLENLLNIDGPTLDEYIFTTKFGGATGGFNSLHSLDYNDTFIEKYDKYNYVNTGFCNTLWCKIADQTCSKFNLVRTKHTTQVDSYHNLINYLNKIQTLNSILYDLCQDLWHYISRNIFCLKVINNEVGSSAMPHKVNPIHFENAMGNISICNGLIQTFANTLPVSIMQRDLRDSTILRQLGNIFSSSLVAWKSILDGLSRLKINPETLKYEINNNIVVVVEGIQTILRFCGNSSAYDILKEKSRGKTITREILLEFVDEIKLDEKFIDIAYHGEKDVKDVKQMMINVINEPEVYFTNKSITIMKEQ